MMTMTMMMTIMKTMMMMMIMIIVIMMMILLERIPYVGGGQDTADVCLGGDLA